MAENTVVKEQLTEDMIEAGAQLTAKLDEMGVSVSAAMWFFEPDTNDWRLLIASPELASVGPRDVYQKIQAARKGLAEKASAVPMSVIRVIDANHELVHLLRMTLRTGAGIGRIRFSRNVINGHFIEDALIYRVA